MMLSWKKMQRVTVCLSDSASSKSRSLSTESFLYFEQKLGGLQDNGYLSKEIHVPGDGLFAFSIEGGWIAIAQRKENQLQQGDRTFTVEIVDLIPVSEFNKSFNYPKLKLNNYLKINEVITLLNSPQVVRIVIIGITTLLIHTFGGEVSLKMEPDGNLLINEVTVSPESQETQSQ